MRRCSTVLLLLGALLAGAACGRDEERPEPDAPPALDAPYALDAPDAGFVLPGVLEEISGLTLLDDGHLGAVQDEDGTLFVLDAGTAEVVGRHSFAGAGDYEGVAQVGARTAVLRSDGRLFIIPDWRAERSEAEALDTGLHADCDAEGLAFDGERLLIACKESPGRGRRGARAIFAFDLARNALLPEPAYLLHADSLARPGGTALDERVRALARPLADINAFKPSALAIHPLSQQRYVLSSVRKLLVVLDPDGTLAAVWPLPERLLPQPEALAFLPDGTLWIASEAAGGRPVLLRYSYRPAP